MQVLTFLLMSFMTIQNTALEIDFGKDKAGQDWRIIDDGVMGGLSQGYLSFQEDAVVFKGNVSLKNNGGFTSFRSPYGQFDLSGYEKVVIRLKSKGQVLAFTMNTDRRWYLPYFKQQIRVSSEEWEVVELPLSEFHAYRIGEQLEYNFSEKEANQVIRMGFITDSKTASSFETLIDYIRFE